MYKAMVIKLTVSQTSRSYPSMREGGVFFFLLCCKGGLERAHFGFFLSSVEQTADPVVQMASGKENQSQQYPATMPQPIVILVAISDT